MPNPYFVVFELVILALFLLTLRHAAHAGTGPLARLLAGVLFGLLLELATIRQLHAYHYGTFTIMIAGVPVAVAVAWGTIAYSVMALSDAMGIVAWRRPVLDGILALNIDLSMDAIAIRLGMWDWGQGLRFDYFGVPYGNFWAWFWVISSFSASSRLLGSRAKGGWAIAAAFAAILPAIGVLLGTNALIAFGIPHALHAMVVAVLLLLAVLLVFNGRPRLAAQGVPALTIWVPFGLHAYFLAAGLISGVILQPPVLLVVSLLMTAFALWLHWRGLTSLWARRPPIGSPPAI